MARNFVTNSGIHKPKTREKINAMCWMKYEKGRRDISIDKRADLVDECVKETLKEHPLK